MELNEIDPAGQEAALRPRSQRLRRGVYLLPSFFTMGNLLCGYYAILSVLEGRAGDLNNAARAIGVAFLFDALDGRVARATGTNSEFGKQFDSLADIVSFGIAPAFIAYAWGVRDLPLTELAQITHIYQLGWWVCFVFVACCAWRLARFNIQGMAPGTSARFFVGLPTPAAAGIVAATVYASSGPIGEPVITFLWLGLVLCVGLLMASTLRYYSFKDIAWTKRQSALRVVVILALLGGAIVFYSKITLLLMAGGYVAHGPVLRLVRTFRHKQSVRTA